MVEHPWMRAPALANMIVFMLAALGIIVEGTQVERKWLIVAGHITLAIFLLLFWLFNLSP